MPDQKHKFNDEPFEPEELYPSKEDWVDRRTVSRKKSKKRAARPRRRQPKKKGGSKPPGFLNL